MNQISDATLVPTPARRRRPGTLRRTLRWLDRFVSPYLYIAPFFLIFGAFGLFPMLYTGWVSLTDRTLLAPATHFVGLDNFTAILHDSYFWNAVENTFAIGLISTVPQLMFALLIAHVLNTTLRGRTLFRMSILLPSITSLVAMTLIFKQFFSFNFGLFNYILGELGIQRLNWEAGRISSWLAISAMITWRWMGYNALIYLAAMQGIPRDLYEAASIDGARKFRQFIHVTVPGIRSTILFTVIISTIGALQIFTEPQLFQTLPNTATGGSARQYQTIVQYLYEKAFFSSQNAYGYGAAIGWCLFLMIIVIGAINYFLVNRIRTSD